MPTPGGPARSCIRTITRHATEARHADWIRRIAGIVPAQSAFDQPASAAHVVQVVDSTDFIVGRTQAAGMPGFTG